MSYGYPPPDGQGQYPYGGDGRGSYSYGQGQQPGYGYQPTHHGPPERRGMSGWAIAAITAAVSMVLVCLVCGVLVIAVPDDDETDSARPSDLQSTSDSATSASSTVDTSTTDTPTSSSSSTSSSESSSSAADDSGSTPGVGDTVTQGDFEIVVDGVREVGTTIGEDFLAETEQGRYVAVDVTVTNIGDESSTFFDGDTVLADAEGRQFSTDSGASFSVEEEVLWLETINPGHTVEGRCTSTSRPTPSWRRCRSTGPSSTTR
ncbi:hypothetical protein GCM10027055_02150 [Janibacter alkaliphilus]